MSADKELASLLRSDVRLLKRISKLPLLSEQLRAQMASIAVHHGEVAEALEAGDMARVDALRKRGVDLTFATPDNAAPDDAE